MYLDYAYPFKQPSMLIMPVKGTIIRPDGMMIMANGTFKEMANWQPSFNVTSRMQNALKYFSNYAPL